MIFNSLTYILFLIIIVSVYWSLSRQYKLLLLLFSSVLFYGFWDFRFVPLLFISIFTDYYFSLLIEKSKEKNKRKIFLISSLIINLTLLGFFKYFYFFTNNFISLASLFGYEIDISLFNIILPIGISFYTFQSMSYTIDVYRKQIKPTKDLLLFSNYVIFFPQLVAGPILRANEILWQLDTKPYYDPDLISRGIYRILGGLALKVLLADNIAKIVNVAFDADPAYLSAIDVSTMAFLFGFQIYFDFAAYSHIALGTALLMGIKFPENFNFPYSASSPRDFWKKWHISLSSWIRDYLYLPIMGVSPDNSSQGGIGERIRVSNIKSTTALFLTWAIMGLWHGANWTFVVWGLWHAICIFIHRLLSTAIVRVLPSFFYSLGSALSLYVIMLGWIPFRAEDLDQALTLLTILLSPDKWFFMGLRENTYLVAFLLLVGVKIAYLANQTVFKTKWSFFSLEIIRWPVTVIVCALILVYLIPLDQFIYFQF